MKFGDNLKQIRKSEKTAELYYNKFSSIIMNGIKEKIKHPFKK